MARSSFICVAALGLILAANTLGCLAAGQPSGTAESTEGRSTERAADLRKQAYSAALAGRNDEALDLYAKALKIATDSHNISDEAPALKGIGDVYRNLGLYQKTLEYHLRALDLARKTGKQRLEAECVVDIGWVYYHWGDYQKAVEFYRQGLVLWEKLGDSFQQGMCRKSVGMVYQGWGRYKQALQFYGQAQEIWTRTGDYQLAAQSLVDMGGTHLESGKEQKAMELFNQALTIAREKKNSDGEVSLLKSIADACSRVNRRDDAIRYYEKALSIEAERRNKNGEMDVLRHIGHLYSLSGRTDKALTYADKALLIAREMGYQRDEAWLQGNIAFAYGRAGQYENALEHYGKALEIDRNLRLVNNIATTLTFMGYIYSQMGRYQKALEVFEEVRDGHRKASDPLGEAHVITYNIAGMYRQWGKYKKALELYEQALKTLTRMGDRFAEKATLDQIASVYSSTGQYMRALDVLETSRKIQQGLASVFLRESAESALLKNIGRIYCSLGAYPDALVHYEKALAIDKKRSVTTKESMALIAEAYLEMGKLDKAEPYLKQTESKDLEARFHLLRREYGPARHIYEEILSFGEKSGNPEMLFIGYTGLGKISEASRDYPKAEAYYEQGMKIAEDLRSGLLPSERKNFFQVRVGGFLRSEPARGLTRVRIKLNKPEASLDCSEATKARSFADAISLRSGEGFSEVPQAVRGQEEMLLTTLASLRKSRNQLNRDEQSERYQELSRSIRDAERKKDQLVAMLREKYHGYASVKYPKPVSLETSALRDNEHVVVFDVLGDGVGVKLIKEKRIVRSLYVPWDEADLEREIARFRDPFENARLEGFDPNRARQIYEKLLSPVLQDVPEGTPLTLMPDGILALIPFESLVVGGEVLWKEGPWGKQPTGLKFMVDVHPISYAASITALTLARTARSLPRTGDRLIAVADPVFDMHDRRAQSAGATRVSAADKGYYHTLMISMEDKYGRFRFQRLPETGKLAQNLAHLYPGQAETLTGLKASKTDLIREISPRFSRYRWIVFATHGLLSTTVPGLLEPCLVLSTIPPGTDGFLTMTEVMGFKMNADLVVLTACETGVGKKLAGEGVMSMGRAFQYAGAQSVLMSLWSVAEVSSVQLVESLFKHINRGNSVIEAVQSARKEIRAAGFDHPFFWAPFILVGECN